MLLTFCFRAEIGRLRTSKKNCEPQEGFVKFCLAKKACVGDGGELQKIFLQNAERPRYEFSATVYVTQDL